MTLRKAEKAVLEAAERWVEDHPATLEDVGLHQAVQRYLAIKSAGKPKPKAKCYCGKTVSIEGNNLRAHRAQDGELHAPSLSVVEARGGEVKNAAF